MFGKILPVLLATVLSASAQPARIVFTAVDRAGAVVSGLGAEDVEMVDGDVVRPIVSLRFGASPMDIVLVMDLSGSTVELARDIAAGARLACRELDAGDRLALVTFTSSWKLRFPLTTRSGGLASRIERSVSSSSWNSGVKLFDAIQGALDLFPASPDGLRTRVVLVVSNSPDRGSRSDPVALIRAARAKQAALFSESIRPPWHLPTIPGNRDSTLDSAVGALRSIAEATGGDSCIKEMTGYLLREFFERARSRYVVDYQPATRQPRPPVIRLSRKGAAAFPNVIVRGAW